MDELLRGVPGRRAIRPFVIGIMLPLWLLAVGNAPAVAAEADNARLSDNSPGVDWAGPGGTYGEQHFSPLTQINAEDISRLALAWFIDLPPGNTVSAPLEIAGALYFVTGWGIVHAVDVKTGRQLWQYDAKTPEHAGPKIRAAWGSRGIAWWNGKIYLGTADGRLIAIDARTGSPVWTVLTTSPDDQSYITGAPRAFDGKIIIGFGGADEGPTRGYVSTYDAETGKLLWRWYTVPGNPANGFENKAMEMAAKTWAGEWWKYGGGGTVWNAMSYDPETHTVIIGVGNGSPWNHKARSAGKGDNLFLCSLVALDADTGAYKWHYQINPGESWDYTATNDMEFASLAIGGQTRKVLMTAPKNGFFYVIDRVNGKLISAEPFVKVNWATKIDLKTGRPVENPAARYPKGTTFTMWPYSGGGHGWYPMAFSPQTKLAYIPAREGAMTWADWEVENDRWRQDSPVWTIQGATMNTLPELNDPLEHTSRLEAWDPVTQKRVWAQPTPGPESGSAMATAGNLVVQGQIDSLNAYAADTGKRLWSFDANAPVFAPPISYSVEGRQYITVLSGLSTSAAMWGEPLAKYHIDYRTTPRRVLTFVLDGKATLPAKEAKSLRPADDPDYHPVDAQASRGARVFGMHCFVCHGMSAAAAGAAPDLRASGIPLSREAFRRVVHDGALVPNGMPRFEELSDAELDDARQYLRSRAAEWRSTLQHHASSEAAGGGR